MAGFSSHRISKRPDRPLHHFQAGKHASGSQDTIRARIAFMSRWQRYAYNFYLLMLLVAFATERLLPSNTFRFILGR
jgi:hypothetical protein